jgi:integrase
MAQPVEGRLSAESVRLTKSAVEGLPGPESGHRVYWDDRLIGFGVRVSARGRRSYFIQSRLPNGRQISVTLGAHGQMTCEQARNLATQMLAKARAGIDPADERRAARRVEHDRRAAPTMKELAVRYLTEHAEPKKRPSSIRADKSLLKTIILPALGRKRVADVTHADVERLHRAHRQSPYAANRAVALLAKMFSLAVRWHLRGDNPCKGIERFQEIKRQRYLTPAELQRLAKALQRRKEDPASSAIAFLLLTGCRRGEALKARWLDFEFEQGIWLKPGATTKRRTDHRLPLSPAALQLLAELGRSSEFVFPGRKPNSALVEIKACWRSVCAEAGIVNCRLHDLRHTHASILASSGISLPIIGALLGHTQASTTHRYSHLFDDPLREAAGRVGDLWQFLQEGRRAEVVPLRSGGPDRDRRSGRTG